MKCKALNEVLRLLAKVLRDPRVESSQRQRLQKFQRELEKIGQTGKPDFDRIFRVTEGIAKVLVEELERDKRNEG